MTMDVQTIIDGQYRLLRDFVPKGVADHNTILAEQQEILNPYDSRGIFISGVIGKLERQGYVETNQHPRNQTEEDHEGGVYHLKLKHKNSPVEVRGMEPIGELEDELGEPLRHQVDEATGRIIFPYKRGMSRTYLFCFAQPEAGEGE